MVLTLSAPPTSVSPPASPQLVAGTICRPASVARRTVPPPALFPHSFSPRTSSGSPSCPSAHASSPDPVVDAGLKGSSLWSSHG